MCIQIRPWYFFRPRQVLRRLCLGRNPRLERKQVMTAWGGLLELDTHRLIGRAIDTTGIFDLAVSELLLRLTDPGSKVVDIGGNIGYMSVLLALKASPGGELSVFEPHPEIFRQLQQNISLNQARIKLNRLELHQTAVGNEAGRAFLVLPEDFAVNDGTAHLAASADNRPGLAVPVTTLDQVFPAITIDVMKLDVEGHEAAVLAGGQKLFSSQRVRHLIFEAHDGPQSSVCQQLLSWGYQLQRIGWSLTKPILASLDAPPIHKNYESPSFIATIDLAEVTDRCAVSGWQSLRLISSR